MTQLISSSRSGISQTQTHPRFRVYKPEEAETGERPRFSAQLAGVNLDDDTLTTGTPFRYEGLLWELCREFSEPQELTGAVGPYMDPHRKIANSTFFGVYNLSNSRTASYINWVAPIVDEIDNERDSIIHSFLAKKSRLGGKMPGPLDSLQPDLQANLSQVSESALPTSASPRPSPSVRRYLIEVGACGLVIALWFGAYYFLASRLGLPRLPRSC